MDHLTDSIAKLRQGGTWDMGLWGVPMNNGSREKCELVIVFESRNLFVTVSKRMNVSWLSSFADGLLRCRNGNKDIMWPCITLWVDCQCVAVLGGTSYLISSPVWSTRTAIVVTEVVRVPVTLRQSFICKFFKSSYLDSHSSESIHIWTIGTLEGRLSFHDSWPQGWCPGVGLEVKI